MLSLFKMSHEHQLKLIEDAENPTAGLLILY